MSRLRFACPIVFALLVAGPAAAAPPTPEALLAALDAAARNGDAAAAGALVSEDFRHAVPDSGERLVAELTRRRVGLTPAGMRIEGRRAALTVRIGEVPRVLLVEQGPAGWLLEGMAVTPEGAMGFLAGQPMRPPRDERLFLAGTALGAALGRGDAEAAEAWMTRAFVAEKRDGGRDLIAQFVRKGLTLTPRDARAVGDVGALMGDVVREGRTVDRIWLLATRQPDDTWRFEAVTEDVSRVEATLARRIPVRFEPRRLPSEPGAAAVVESIRGALAARQGAAAVEALGPGVKPTPGIGLPRARRWLLDAAGRVAVVSPAAVHVDRKSGRGAARFVVRLKSDPGAADKGGGGQTVWLYLLRADGRWAVVDLGFGLAERWFHAPAEPAP